MSKTDTKHALYLVRDGEGPKLFHADDVEAAKADGWKEPDFAKSNGEAWNAEADLDNQTAAAEFAKAREEAENDKRAKEAEEAAKAEAEKPESEPTPDMRVEIVEPAGKSKASKSTTTSARSGTTAKK